jgi:hypothetical protein
MDGSRLGQTVRKAHLENIANPPFDRRPGELAVERPGFNGRSRSDTPIDLTSFEVNGNDVSIYVGLSTLVSTAIGLARIRRKCVRIWTVVIVAMSPLVVIVVTVLGHKAS